MKYSDLHIQTQREAPNNARSEGFAFLVRAGYLTRENQPTTLGTTILNHLKSLAMQPNLLERLGVPRVGKGNEQFFLLASGPVEITYCPNCQDAYRLEFAPFVKTPFSDEALLPLEKIATPACNTIEALAALLNIPKEKTAKALMFTRVEDGKFVFVCVRGDMQLSEAKLQAQVGDIRLATPNEISQAGAVAGYASPIGLKDALIAVDDLIPRSPNLVAGANQAGYHLANTNYGRDYTAASIADFVQAQVGEPCTQCGSTLTVQAALPLATEDGFVFENILLALAETYHDAKGLMLPTGAAPFDVYLMALPGKELDTLAQAEELERTLREAGLRVLFDDRNERAGVKFNDADLIGCPVRVTVGERALKEGMVELKLRIQAEVELIALQELLTRLKALIPST